MFCLTIRKIIDGQRLRRLHPFVAAKSMSVEQFLRWRRRAPKKRYAVQAALLRLRTELYERQMKRARRVVEEADGGEEEEEAE